MSWLHWLQIELRVLAHLSGDAQLVGLLRGAGVDGDAFRFIASSWLKQPAAGTGTAGTSGMGGMGRGGGTTGMGGAGRGAAGGDMGGAAGGGDRGGRGLGRPPSNGGVGAGCVTKGDVGGVTKEERDLAKRIVYGIIYGQTPFGLQQQIGPDKVRPACRASSVLPDAHSPTSRTQEQATTVQQAVFIGGVRLAASLFHF